MTRFIDDGRIEIDFNVVERAIRPIALNRKNALFAGSDGGAENWAIVASLIETCKLNRVDFRTSAQCVTARTPSRALRGVPREYCDEYKSAAREGQHHGAKSEVQDKRPASWGI